MKHSKSIQIEFIKHAINITNPYKTFTDFIYNKTFIHPHTRNKVKFESLPISTQKFIKTQYEHQRIQELYNLTHKTFSQKPLDFYSGAQHSPQLKHILGYPSWA